MARLRFFDANVMFGPTLAPIPAPLADTAALLGEMDAFGIEQALAWRYAFGTSARLGMNGRTLEATRGSARLIPCWVLRTAPALRGERIEEQAQELRAAGVRAARIIADEGPTATPITLHLFEVTPLLDALSRRRIPLLLPADHLGRAPGAFAYGFEQIDSICREYPALPVVLLEPRYQTQPQLIALLRRHANLYLTISGLGMFRQIESFAAMAGARRLLFSSNLPFGDPALPLGALLYSSLGLADRQRIAGDNLRRLLEEVR